jgi:hypothetical protein
MRPGLARRLRRSRSPATCGCHVLIALFFSGLKAIPHAKRPVSRAVRCRKARSLLRRATPEVAPIGEEARVVDMQVNPVGLTLGPMATDEHTARRALAGEIRIDEQRLDQLMRWHGTDEINLPPAHTLQNLSRDTVAALDELREARETIEQLRAAMGKAFWATEFRDLHAILLEALGPPPDEVSGA